MLIIILWETAKKITQNIQPLFSLIFSIGGFYCYVLELRASSLGHVQFANKPIKGIFYFCYSVLLCFCLMSTLSIRSPSIFIIVVQHSNVPATSGSDACRVSSNRGFCLLIDFAVFFLIAGQGVLGKGAAGNRSERRGGRGGGSTCLCPVSILSVSPCLSSVLRGGRVAAAAWSWEFPSPT